MRLQLCAILSRFFACLLIQICCLSQSLAQLQPHIVSFSPDSGTDQRLVTISGFNFTGATAVRFGATAARSYGVANDSTINAIVGAGSTGYIVVTVGSMTDSMAGFRYVPNIPIVQSFTPTTGMSGTVVRITGNHLTSTTGITFGGVPVSFFAVHDDMLVSAFVANGASGYVTVTTSYGKDSLGGFIFQDSTISPVITGFSPDSATAGTAITITGKHFTGINSVNFGGLAAKSLSVLNDSVIVAVVSTGASGDVQISSSLGTSSSAGFVYLSTIPFLYSFSPDSAITGTQILIRGKNLSGVTSVSFGGIAATNFNIVDDSLVYATVGAGASGYVVLNSGGAMDSLAGFVYQTTLPKILSFTPAVGTSGTVVIIHGFHLSGTNAVRFGGVPSTFIAVKDDNTVSAFVGAGSSGFVSLTTNTGTDSLAGFLYLDSFPKPVIQSFSPDSAKSNDPVMISGLHLQHTMYVYFGGVQASSFNVISDSSIIAFPGNGASGDIIVNTAEGSDSLGGFLYITTPIPPKPPDTLKMISFSPKVAAAGALVFIEGLHLSGTTSVRFGGTPARNFIVKDDHTISAFVDGGSSGYVTIMSANAIDSLPGFIFSSGTMQPNPATNSINVVFPANANVTKVVLQNMNGVQIRTVAVSANSASVTLDISGVPPGIYTVTWGNGSTSESKILMVQ